MAFITPFEIFDIIMMALAIGFIFSDHFRRPVVHETNDGKYDPLKYYTEKRSSIWENTKFAAMITAPPLVLHELSHKFIAMYYGATATLHAPYTMYAIAVIMKLMSFPLLFFVGGYVEHTQLPALPSAFVSFAGPLMNFLVWFICWALVRYKFAKRNSYKIIVPMGRISLFLGIFNMIPIPGFDGWNFITSMINVFKGM